MPLFSVLIANYNNGRFIRRALESVLEQTFTDWELIVVDDASVDDSVEIINSYIAQDQRIRLFQHAANEGCGSTKRDCASNASGELCGFLDPDDALSADALAVMAGEHQRHPEVSMVYSRFWFCDPELNVRHPAQWVKSIPKGETNLFHDKIMHFVSFKKKAYDQTEGIGKQYSSAVDKDLYYKLEEVGPVRFVDRELYFYRENPKGMSQFHNYIAAQDNHFRVIESAMERRRKSGFPSLTSSQYRLIRSRIFMQRAELMLRLGYPAGEVFRWLRRSFSESPFSFNLLRIKYLFLSWSRRPHIRQGSVL